MTKDFKPLRGTPRVPANADHHSWTEGVCFQFIGCSDGSPRQVEISTQIRLVKLCPIDNHGKFMGKSCLHDLCWWLNPIENEVVSCYPDAPRKKDDDFHEERDCKLLLQVFKGCKAWLGRHDQKINRTQQSWEKGHCKNKCSIVSSLALV